MQNTPTLNIVIFGPPGVGKGTQSTLLAKKYNSLHISTGDLLRAEVNKQTHIGELITNALSRKELIPDELVIDLLCKTIVEHPTGVILDGFPYTFFQAMKLDELLNERKSKVHIAFQIEAETNELIERISIRAKTSGRTEDQNMETIVERIKYYSTDSNHLSMIEFYKQRDILKQIDGMGTIETIFEELCSEIEKTLSCI